MREGTLLSRSLGLIAVIAVAAVLSALMHVFAVVLYVALLDLGPVPEVTWQDTTLALRTSPVVIVTVFISMFRQEIRTLAVASKVTSPSGPWALPLRVIYLATGAAALLLIGLWSYGWSLAGVIYAYGFVLQPVGVTLLILFLGRRGWGPGVWVAQWTVEAVRRRSVFAERTLHEAQNNVDTLRGALLQTGNGRGLGLATVRRRGLRRLARE